MAIIVQAHHPVSDQDAQQAVATAEVYLRQSDLATFVWDELRRVPEVLTIHVYDAPIDSVEDVWVPPATGSTTSAGEVVWNLAMRVLSAEEATHDPRLNAAERLLAAATPARLGIMSPALLLMHELGHAFQFLSDQVVHEEGNSFRQRVQSALQGNGNVRLEIENINVSAIENTVARELSAKGFPEGLRWDYQHGIAIG